MAQRDAESRARRLRGARVRARAARGDAHRRSTQRGVRRGAALALAKNPEKRDALQTIASQSLQGFQQLTVMLAPVLPGVARRVARELFGLDRDFVWNDAWAEPSIVRPFKHLMTRIAEKQIDALLAGPEFLTPGPSPAAAENVGMRVRRMLRRSPSTTSPRSTCAWRA